jgi:hypothetical protein
VVVVDDGGADGTVVTAPGDRCRSASCGATPIAATARRCARIAAARRAWVLLIDGDGQMDPGQLGELVAALDGHDGVIGFRARRADAWMRRVNTAAWNGAVRWLFGLVTRDVNCAFKLLPTELLQDETLCADGAVISAEILVRAERAAIGWRKCRSRIAPRRSGRFRRAAGVGPRRAELARPIMDAPRGPRDGDRLRPSTAGSILRLGERYRQSFVRVREYFHRRRCSR